MSSLLKFCSGCVMDGTAEEITFDENGVCNFCHQAHKSLREVEREKVNLPKITEQIKKDGKGKKYDVLLGLSGGVDSSTTLHHAVKLGLRPLTFGMDNGYNSPTSDENVMRLVEGLKVPYERHVIDLKRFKELQAAFMKSGVPNIEIPTDAVIMALTFQIAKENGIKWILSGGNVATESIMPTSWGYNARDLVHIKSIYKKFTGKRLEGLPLCGLLKWNIYRWYYGMKTIYLLDFFDYNRGESEKMLSESYGYKSTGEKHCENVFTQWHISYYLFEKFGIDKRKAHYSSLINSGQMTRGEAMNLLSDRPIYPRLGIEDRVMKYPKHSHDDYEKDEWLFNLIGSIVRVLQWRF